MDVVKKIKLRTAYSSRQYPVDVVKAEYEKGGIALIAVESKSGMEFATLTSWIPGIPEGQVAIKNYSENEGFAQQLVDQGVVRLTGAQLYSGHAAFPLAEVLV